MRNFYFLLWTHKITIIKEKTVKMIYFYTAETKSKMTEESFTMSNVFIVTLINARLSSVLLVCTSVFSLSFSNKWKHKTLEVFQKSHHDWWTYSSWANSISDNTKKTYFKAVVYFMNQIKVFESWKFMDSSHLLYMYVHSKMNGCFRRRM